MTKQRAQLTALGFAAALGCTCALVAWLSLVRADESTLTIGSPVDVRLTRSSPLLDIDVKKLLALPESVTRERRIVADWAAEHGVDVIGGHRALTTHGMKTQHIENDTAAKFITAKQYPDHLAEDVSLQIGRLLSEGRPQSPVRLKASNEDSGWNSYVFNTREGANGVMQFKWSEDPGAIALRYRLLESEPLWKADSTAATFQVRGRVVKLGGEPASGANIRVFNGFTGEGVGDEVKTDTDGRFELTLSKAPFSKGANQHDAWRLASIVVDAKGLVKTWASAHELQANPVLQLSEDHTPILGRVIDLEGQPVSAVDVKVVHLIRPKTQDFDQFLADYQKSPARMQRHIVSHGVFAPKGVLQLANAVTDEQGRFELRGIGAERVVQLSISGPGIEGCTMYVLTRTGDRNVASVQQLTAETRRFLEQGIAPALLYSARFTHVVAPGVSVRGVVKGDVETPISGVDLLCTINGQNFSSTAQTDESGAYTLYGIRKGSHVRISVRCNPKYPYPSIDRSMRIDTDTAEVDFSLKRGVLVDGKVTLGSTEEPVRGRVYYFGFGDNPSLKELDGSLSYYNSIETDDDGRYALYVPRGPGLLTVKAYAARGSRQQFANSTNKEYGRRFDNARGFTRTTSRTIRPSDFHAAHVIAPDTDPLHVDLTVKAAPK